MSKQSGLNRIADLIAICERLDEVTSVMHNKLAGKLLEEARYNVALALKTLADENAK